MISEEDKISYIHYEFQDTLTAVKDVARFILSMEVKSSIIFFYYKLGKLIYSRDSAKMA